MEIMDIKDKVGHSHECTHKDIKQAALQRAADEARRPPTEEKVVDVEVDASHLLQHTLTAPQGIPRTPVANTYVIHIFSGAQRPGDLQSAIMDMIPPDGTTPFPVSIDIVLSELLDTKQQCQWLTWARQGAIHMAIGGPPCETWSISRLRWHEDDKGPRPLKDGRRLDDHIWGLPQLRIREARQIRVANVVPGAGHRPRNGNHRAPRSTWWTWHA